MPKFTYNDIVQIATIADVDHRLGAMAWIVAISQEKDRWGDFKKKFPEGVIYTIEYEDGSSTEAHEDILEFFKEE